MRKILFVFFLVPTIVVAQVEQGRKTVEKLCSRALNGRGYVKAGDSLAAEFIANEFKQMGCQFFNGNPFQPFQFQVNTFPGRVSCELNGEKLIPGIDFVVSPSTPKVKLDSLVVYRMTTADLFDGKNLRKKIIKQRDSGPNMIGSAFAFEFSRWKGDTLKVAKELAEALSQSMHIVEIVEGKFTWSVSQTQSRFAWVEINSKVLDPEADSWYLSLYVDAKLVNHQARNVIAYVPAKKKSKKYFVFTAHYDHLGAMGLDAYFPGANDNASGTAMLIELARHFVSNPSNVNVVFIAFAGEEVGLLGSGYYTQHPVFPLNQINFLFNIDIMGSGEDGATVVNATLHPEQFDVLKSLNEKGNYLPKIASRGKAANSDHYFFTEKGVPAFFMYTMGPNKHYHDVEDTYEALSFNKFNEVIRLLIEFEKVISWKR